LRADPDPTASHSEADAGALEAGGGEEAMARERARTTKGRGDKAVATNNKLETKTLEPR